MEEHIFKGNLGFYRNLFSTGYLLYYKPAFTSRIEITLCVITDNEKDLDKDRFRNFSFDSNITNFNVVCSKSTWIKSETFQSCIESFINWISDNIQNKWCLSLDYRHMTDIDIILSFEDKNDALLFKLSN